MKKILTAALLLGLVGLGTTSCKDDDKKKDEPTVPVKSIKLDKDAISIEEGATAKLVATVDPADAKVVWTSSDAAIVTVDNGNLTAKKEGKATITAKAGDKSAKCMVTITKKGGGGAESEKYWVKGLMFGNPKEGMAVCKAMEVKHAAETKRVANEDGTNDKQYYSIPKDCDPNSVFFEQVLYVVNKGKTVGVGFNNKISKLEEMTTEDFAKKMQTYGFDEVFGVNFSDGSKGVAFHNKTTGVCALATINTPEDPKEKPYSAFRFALYTDFGFTSTSAKSGMRSTMAIQKPMFYMMPR